MLKSGSTNLRPGRRMVHVAAFGLVLALLAGCTSVGGAPRIPGQAAQPRSSSGTAAGVARASANLTFDDLEEVASAISRVYVDPVSSDVLIDGAERGLYFGAAQAGIWPVDVSLLSYDPERVKTNSTADWENFRQRYGVLRNKTFRQHRNTDLVSPMIKGMLESLHDPATTLLEPEDVMNQARSEPGGIGIGLTDVEGESLPAVGTVYANGPAERAGVRTGELIVAIDGKSTAGMNWNEVISAIRGREGTRVTLTLRAPEAREARELQIVRELVFPFQTAFVGGIAYIQVAAFDRGIADLVAGLFRNALRAGASGWILDLRGNRSSGPEEFVEVLQIGRLIVGDRPLGIAVSRSGRQEELATDRGPVAPALPLALLVDGNSATGAEVLAAALRDYGAATIVGSRTSGAGAIASDLRLSNGSAVRIAVRSVTSPSGTSLRGVGVTPDELVEIAPEDRGADRDPQLERAVGLLRSIR